MFALEDESPPTPEEKIKNEDFTFRDCVEHPVILQHFISTQMRAGDPASGFPVLHPGDSDKVAKFDDAVYECSKSRVFNRHATKPHGDLPFLRKACVVAAVDALKDRCLYPVRCKARDMPNDEPWDNFGQCLYTFYVEYCFREGLAMTSDLSRQVLLYIFYGSFVWTYRKKKISHERRKSVLFWLQKKVSQGRSRFVQNADTYFTKFVSLVKEKKWQKFLHDKGEGDPPVEYLGAVEEGLRAYSVDIHTMGTHVLRTPEHWKNVAKWRKREAFISIMRILCGFTSSYRQWDCFLFTDYVFRQEMSKVFNLRHYPLSDGNDSLHFGPVVDFKWEDYSYVPKKKKCSTVKTETTPKKRTKTTKSKPKVYDLTTGEFQDW